MNDDPALDVVWKVARAELAAWVNGVADAVEPLGYDRYAACGPADLLPGLDTLVAAHRELAALKARRCDGCQWWTANPMTPGYGLCTHDAATAFVAGPTPDAFLRVRPGHACNAWIAATPEAGQ